MKEEFLIITFDSVHQALALEDICNDGRIIPLPTEISAGCGFAWATRNRDKSFWINYLEKNEIKYEKMVVMEL